MNEYSVANLPFPIENRTDLKEAFQIVQALRQDPAAILSWDPEAEQPTLHRQRLELALSLLLVASLNTGSGEIESRAKACQQLFVRNIAAPAEAVKAGELLFRSRLLLGATDIETFWLAAAFAHPLHAITHPDLREIAWLYLCNAPFALDQRTALQFAKASQHIQRSPFSRWPMELIESLMRLPKQAELGATLLETHLCVLLDAQNLEELVEELDPHSRLPQQALLDALELLARYYVRTESDQIHARDIIRIVADNTVDDAPYRAYLEEQTFDLPHEDLYETVKSSIGDTTYLDTLYESYLAHEHLEIARRLVECELVKRLDPWYLGGIQPHIRRALLRVIGGADIGNPRIRLLAGRLAVLHSRTRFGTEEARTLVRRIAVLPEYTGTGSPLEELRAELELFIAETEPVNLLERERGLIKERWDDFDDSEKLVLDEVDVWMRERFKPRVESLKPAARARHGTGSDAIGAMNDKRTVTRAIEHTLKRLYGVIFRPSFSRKLCLEVETALGTPFRQINQADISRIVSLARRYANRDRITASAGGLLAGLIGGPWGVSVDIASVVVVSARSAVRIGACFGIEPGTPRGFEFLIDALTMSCSTDTGHGLIAYLMDQRPMMYHMAAVGGALYGAGQARSSIRNRFLSSTDAGAKKRLASVEEKLGLSTASSVVGRLIPFVSAVFTGGANYWFSKELTEASLYIAARQWVLGRHGLLSRQEGDPAESEPIGKRRGATRYVW